MELPQSELDALAPEVGDDEQMPTRRFSRRHAFFAGPAWSPRGCSLPRARVAQFSRLGRCAVRECPGARSRRE